MLLLSQLPLNGTEADITQELQVKLPALETTMSSEVQSIASPFLDWLTVSLVIYDFHQYYNLRRAMVATKDFRAVVPFEEDPVEGGDDEPPSGTTVIDTRIEEEGWNKRFSKLSGAVGVVGGLAGLAYGTLEAVDASEVEQQLYDQIHKMSSALL